MEIFEEKIVSDFERTKEGRTRVGFGEKRLTGQEIAGYNLFKALEKYPDFTKEARFDLQEEFVDFKDLGVLNLDTFAAVLAFLKLYPEPTPKNFEKDVLPYFSRLLPSRKISPEEKKRLTIRLKAQFVKYIRAINLFREEEF